MKHSNILLKITPDEFFSLIDGPLLTVSHSYPIHITGLIKDNEESACRNVFKVYFCATGISTERNLNGNVRIVGEGVCNKIISNASTGTYQWEVEMNQVYDEGKKINRAMEGVCAYLNDGKCTERGSYACKDIAQERGYTGCYIPIEKPPKKWKYIVDVL